MELYGEGGVRRPGVALSAQTRRRLSFNFSGVQGNNITLVNRATVTYTDGSNTLTAEASTSGNFSC
jgi:hypothetical protein